MSANGRYPELRAHLLEHSVKRGDFTLKSGRKSSWFIDSKQTVCRPEAMVLVADGLLSVIPTDADAIGGLTMGADPVAFVTAAGMNREVLALGEVGLSAASEREWVDALTALLGNPNLRRNMGAAGRAVVEERFSLKRLAQQYAAAFHSLRGTLPRGHSLPNPI